MHYGQLENSKYKTEMSLLISTLSEGSDRERGWRVEPRE